MFRKLGLVLFAVMMVMSLVPAGADAGNGNGRGNGNSGETTRVPGHANRTSGYVNGHYTSVYAYDAAGDNFQDLGDGRIQGTVGSIDELDRETLTICKYVNNYRADFGDNPGMDEGWIQNHITCTGYESGTYYYLIVSQTDPRYTGNEALAVWGTWEYHVLVISGEGNTARPMKEPGNLGN